MKVFYSLIFLLFSFTSVYAEGAENGLSVLRDEVNLLWLMIAAFLVFLMQGGFAYVEAGFTRGKNAVNIIMKNLTDFSVGSIFFWLIGFSIMFGPQMIDGFGIGSLTMVESELLSVDGKPDAAAYGFLIFQMVFAATAATIVSGAMAERTKFKAYIIYSVVITSVIYPVYGSFAWASLFDSENTGWLENMGFVDFAGSTVVHSLGAWVGLAGAIVLGPRIGKYNEDGSIRPIFGHNIPMAALGALLLWFGWFGFNPGSTGAVDGGEFAIVAVTTNMAAATGAVTAMITSWIMFKQADVTMVINGMLAGLVAITAGCYNVSITGAVSIGAVAGVLVVLSVVMFDHLHIDDPVGAVSVHGIAGAWGTLAVGLFADPAFGGGPAGLFYGGGFEQLWVQFVGVAVAFIWALGAGMVLFLLLKYTIGIRVPEEEEIEGLDTIEHGTQAYPDIVN